MPKENVYSLIDCPRFDPRTTEEWPDEQGIIRSRELFLTPIRLKKGIRDRFIAEFRQKAAANQPCFLEFFSPAGMTMTAEVRNLTRPEEQSGTYFDSVNFLVALSSDQVLAIFPYDDETDSFGY